MGLLDFVQTPEGQGLLSAVAGGLAGARRGTPLNNLGQAGISGLIGYQCFTAHAASVDGLTPSILATSVRVMSASCSMG